MDTRQVCEALELHANELAAVAEREAARYLRMAAAQLDNGEPGVARLHARTGGHWLSLADIFDAEWESSLERRSGDGAQEATKPTEAPVAVPNDLTDLEDWSA